MTRVYVTALSAFTAFSIFALQGASNPSFIAIHGAMHPVRVVYAQNGERIPLFLSAAETETLSWSVEGSGASIITNERDHTAVFLALTNGKGTVRVTTTKNERFSLKYETGYTVEYRFFAPALYDDERFVSTPETPETIERVFATKRLSGGNVHFLSGRFARIRYARPFFERIGERGEENAVIVIYLNAPYVMHSGAFYIAAADTVAETLSTYLPLETIVTAALSGNPKGIVVILDGAQRNSEIAIENNRVVLRGMNEPEFASAIAARLKQTPTLIVSANENAPSPLIERMLSAVQEQHGVDREGIDGRMTIADYIAALGAITTHTDTLGDLKELSLASYAWVQERSVYERVTATEYEETEIEETYERKTRNFIAYKRERKDRTEKVGVRKVETIQETVIPGYWE